MFKSNEMSDAQKKWILVTGLVAVLGFSTSFHQYDANPHHAQFAQLGAPQAEGIVIMSSTSAEGRSPNSNDELPPPPSDDSESADDNSSGDAPADRDAVKASGAAATTNQGRKQIIATATVNGKTYPVKLSIGEDDQVMMQLKLDKDAMEAIGMPCTGTGTCSGEITTGLGITAQNNLGDLSEYRDAMKEVIQQSPLVKKSSDSSEGNVNADKVASEDSEDSNEEKVELSPSAKKFAEIEKKCESKSSDRAKLTCRMDKFKTLLSKKSNKIDKDEALDYYKENIEESLQSQFVSFAIGDYAKDQASALNPQQAQLVASEMQTSFTDFNSKSQELLKEMKSLHSSILADYSEIRESLTNMSVKVLAQLALKGSEYARDSKLAISQGRTTDATTALQALALQKTLFQNVFSGLFAATNDGLNSAVQADIISRQYANNMSGTVREYGNGILSNFSSLGQLDPMTAQTTFETRLNSLDQFDYMSGRPSTIVLNGKIFQEVGSATTGSTTTATGTSGVANSTTTGSSTTTLGASDLPARPNVTPSTSLLQIRNNLGRGSGTVNTITPNTTLQNGSLQQGPVTPFRGF